MLKTSILAVSLILIAQAYAEYPECAKGPSFWCESIQNSNKCNAFKHCLQTVWGTHTKYLKKSPVLKLDNTPNSCNNCVQCVGAEVTKCPYVHLFKEEITQMKNNNIPTETICKLMRQCNEDEQNNNDEPIETDNNKQEDEIKPLLDNNQIEYKFDSRFKCGLHPRNWCDNLETIKRCEAFDTCLNKWTLSNLKYRAKDIDENLSNKDEVVSQKTCGFCIFIFNKLQQVLQQNSTEVNVKDYLESACSLLPSQEASNDCVKAVDQNLPEIYNLIRNNIDSGIICRVLKQCSDKYLEEISSESDKKSDLFKDLKITFLNEKEAIIKTPLQKSKRDQILLGSKSEILVVELTKSAGVACELCTIVMNAAKIMIINKRDDEKVLNFIENQLCARLGSLNNTCVEYVKAEGPEIIQLLLQAVDPSLICRAMGLCLKIQVSEENINDKFYDLNLRDPSNCILCKKAFEQVKIMQASQNSQAEIIDYINSNLCHKVGKSEEMCKSLIDAYGLLFLEIVSCDVQPAQLCSMIGMGSKQDENQVIEQNDIKPSTDLTGGVNCVLCEFVMNVLVKYINQNSTAPEIEKALQYVCDHAMPSTIKAECSSFVASYGNIIISLLINQVSPDKICKFIGLCTKTQIPKFETNFQAEQELFIFKSKEIKKTASERIKETRSKEIKCTVCEYAMQYINTQYQVDRTEKAIEFTMANVCKFTPNSYRSHCDSMVDTYGIGLINFIEKYSDPSKVCGSIKMCHVEEKIVEEKPIELVNIVPATPVKIQEDLFDNNKTVQCSLCIYVAELVDNKLNQNETEEQIVKELQLVCNLFPSSLKDQCIAFIEEYGPYVVQLIAADLDPDTTCAALKLCPKTIVKDSLRHALLNKF